MRALLEVYDVVVDFPTHRRRLPWRAEQPAFVRAVDKVSFTLLRGQALGIVGESGCGKSTTAGVIVGLATPTSGAVCFDGHDVTGDLRTREQRGRIQMVFQDPAGALNPRLSVRGALREIVKATDHASGSRTERHAALEHRLEELMQMVELPVELLNRYPRTLSGGQRQRVSIARALASRPDLLVLDEAIAALDVSVQAAVLELLASLKEELQIGLILISHNLGAVRSLCETVIVMNSGRIVEQGSAEQIFSRPTDPYTQQLLGAEPRIERSTPEAPT